MTTPPITYYVYITGFTPEAPAESIPLDSSISEGEIAIQRGHCRLSVDLNLTKIPAGVQRIRFTVQDRKETDSSW